MRHTFRFPQNARDTLKQHVRLAIANTDPSRFFQEPSYTAALIRNLEGVIYDQDRCYIEVKSTDVDHIGPKAAEKWSGADLVITAKISNANQTIEKAILFQAKRGIVSKLHSKDEKDLRNQIQKMKHFTKSPQVMQIVDDGSKRKVAIISGNNFLFNKSYTTVNLEDYFVRRILTTFDGDTRPEFIEAVQEHSLSKLMSIAKTPISRKEEGK